MWEPSTPIPIGTDPEEPAMRLNDANRDALINSTDPILALLQNEPDQDQRAGLIEGLAFLVERLALDNNVRLPQLGIETQLVLRQPTHFDDDDRSDQDLLKGNKRDEDDGAGEEDDEEDDDKEDDDEEDDDEEDDDEKDDDEKDDDEKDDDENDDDENDDDENDDDENDDDEEDDVKDDDEKDDDEEDDDGERQEDTGQVVPSGRTNLVTSRSLQAIAAPARAVKQNTTLTKLTVTIADDVDIKTMIARRDNFLQWMQDAKAKSKQHNRSVRIEFTAEDMIQIPNFFFDQIMGVGGVSHLSSLIGYYSHHSKGNPDKGVGMRAEELATDDVSRPEIVRRFFGRVSQQQALSHSNSTLFKMLRQNILNVDVLNHLNTMRDLAQKRDLELCAYLDHVDEKPDIGKGYASCLINHLSHSLGLTKNAFDALTQTAQAPHALVTEFGPGVLCLLPKGAATKMVRLTVGKVRAVAPVIGQMVPELRPLCELLTTSLLVPMMNGHALRIGEVKVSGRESLMTRVQNAIRDLGYDPATTGGFVEDAEEGERDADGGGGGMEVDGDGCPC